MIITNTFEDFLAELFFIASPIQKIIKVASDQ